MISDSHRSLPIRTKRVSDPHRTVPAQRRTVSVRQRTNFAADPNCPRSGPKLCPLRTETLRSAPNSLRSAPNCPSFRTETVSARTKHFRSAPKLSPLRTDCFRAATARESVDQTSETSPPRRRDFDNATVCQTLNARGEDRVNGINGSIFPTRHRQIRLARPPAAHFNSHRLRDGLRSRFVVSHDLDSLRISRPRNNIRFYLTHSRTGQG